MEHMPRAPKIERVPTIAELFVLLEKLKEGKKAYEQRLTDPVFEEQSRQSGFEELEADSADAELADLEHRIAEVEKRIAELLQTKE